MSYTLLSAKDKTAAKDHYCDWCGEKILKGKTYNYRAGTYEGELQTTKLHLECIAPCMAECDAFGCFDPGQGKRPVIETPPVKPNPPACGQ